MSLETVALEHLPAGYAIHVAFFREVRNAAFLHEQLLARNAEFEYAFVDASVILSRTHLLSSVFRAAYAAADGSLKTPNVHSETVVSLSPSTNIADAYRRYGISRSTKDLLVVKVTFPSEANPSPVPGDKIWEHLKSNVEGEPTAVTNENIAAATDLAKVRKYYKLNGLPWLDRIEDERVKRQEMEGLILSAMALRGV